MQKYVISAILTLLVEGTVSGVLTRNKDWVIYVSLVNLVTNPAVNLLYNGLKPIMGHDGRMVLTAVLEVAVVITEAILFHKYRKKERPGLKPLSKKACLFCSLILNASSYFAGVLLQKAI
ncbi:MAG: hypothetical protein K6F63_00170 [Lachnospiraceae bacterium]|nr:hypothetical protein [Lachnospiraceae bacterium]